MLNKFFSAETFFPRKLNLEILLEACVLFGGGTYCPQKRDIFIIKRNMKSAGLY